jgi:hypothetical protein
MEQYHQHITMQKRTNSSSHDNQPVFLDNTITDMDVLSGRGGKTNNHRGNKLFRALVKQNRQNYQETKSSTCKQLLAESIIASVQQKGGRFLKRHGKEDGGWVELSMDEAFVKTTQALREIPTGTSPRALNVERMIERKRMKGKSSVNASRPVQKTVMPIQPECDFLPADCAIRRDGIQTQAVYEESHTTSSNRSDPTCDPLLCSFDDEIDPEPNGECNDLLLNEEELNRITSDPDTIQTLVSLLE